MKIKIIDLLVKIANREEVPKKIKWENIIYAYSEYDKDYLEYPFSNEEYKGLFDMRDNILTQFLNDEVEIIEEDKKIEKLDIKQEKNIKNNWKWKCNGYNISTPQKIMADKLNELIDYINKGGKDEYR